MDVGKCNVKVWSVWRWGNVMWECCIGRCNNYTCKNLPTAYQVHCSVQLLTVFGGIPESMAMTVRV